MAAYLVFVPLERMQLFPGAGIEDKHARAARSGKIIAVGAIGDVIHYALQAVLVRNMLLPGRDNAHLKGRCKRRRSSGLGVCATRFLLC